MEVVETLSEALADQLHTLYQNEWWSAGRTREQTTRVLEGSDLTLALVEEGRLCAFARVLSDGVFKAFLFDVIVAPDLRSQGVGRKLLDAVLAHPRVAAAAHVELYCKPEMRDYYRQWGFLDDLPNTRLMRLGD